MFSSENNGYNKEEVDRYITKLKTELMEKKLSLLDCEQQILDLKQQKSDIEIKEKNIMKALSTIEYAQKIQEEGSKNLYNLSTKQNEIIYENLISFLDNLWVRHPDVKSDKEIYESARNLEEITEKSKNIGSKNISTDPMRMLLSKMQQYREQGNVKTVRVERNNIKPIDENKDVEEFLSTKPESDKLYRNVEFDASGFDLKEAVNPKQDLDEIMKAFDFFNNNDNK